jgi:hypothetical protein
MIGFTALLAAAGRRYADNLRRLTPAVVMRPAVLLPLFAAFAGELAFRTLDWGWLQAAMRDLVVGVMTVLGAQAVSLGAVGYSVGDTAFVVTARCTYADLLCFTTPLILVPWSLPESAKRVVVWWATIFLVCVARIIVAHLLYDAGLTWFLAHDAIDYGLRSLAMLAVLAYWLDASISPVLQEAKPVENAEMKDEQFALGRQLLAPGGDPQRR